MGFSTGAFRGKVVDWVEGLWWVTGEKERLPEPRAPSTTLPVGKFQGNPEGSGNPNLKGPNFQDPGWLFPGLSKGIKKGTSFPGGVTPGIGFPSAGVLPGTLRISGVFPQAFPRDFWGVSDPGFKRFLF